MSAQEKFLAEERARMRTEADCKQERFHKLATLEYFYLEHLAEDCGNGTDFDHAILHGIQALRDRFCPRVTKETG